MSYAMDNFGSCYLLDVKSTSPKIGNITDTSPNSLKGGRLGVYCDSQQNIRWSGLSYKYDDQIFLEKYCQALSLSISQSLFISER